MATVPHCVSVVTGVYNEASSPMPSEPGCMTNLNGNGIDYGRGGT